MSALNTAANVVGAPLKGWAPPVPLFSTDTSDANALQLQEGAEDVLQFLPTAQHRLECPRSFCMGHITFLTGMISGVWRWAWCNPVLRLSASKIVLSLRKVR